MEKKERKRESRGKKDPSLSFFFLFFFFLFFLYTFDNLEYRVYGVAALIFDV